MVQTQDLMSKIQMGRWSDEEYLLGQAKHKSNIDPNNQGDLLRNSSDRDVHHEHTRMRGTQKISKGKLLPPHCMYCSYFLATFMWRKPLNSAALVTTTHRKPKKVSNGIDTQVRAQMINKCRIKMVQRDLYNVKDPP